VKLTHDPIQDREVKDSIDKILSNLSLATITTVTHNELDLQWRHWLLDSSYNTVIGLDSLPYSAFCPGTTDAFGEFIARYPTHTIRVSRNDFVMTKILAKSWNRNLKFLEDDPLENGDCVLTSLPFSGNGSYHAAWPSILDQADELDVPVFIDAAYFGISHDTVYPLNRTCIKDFTVSLSKNLVGNPLRLGIRFTRDQVDDGITAGLIGSDIFDRLNAYISIELLKTYSHDWFISKYKHHSDTIAKNLGLSNTNTVTLKIGNESMTEFKRGDFIRVVVSDELSRAAG
jgi:hypothetical protein